MKKYLVFIISFLLFTSKVISQQSVDYVNQLNTLTTAVPFLLIDPDARGGGLGDAGVSSSPDANSMHFNPAKYAFIDKSFGFSVSYSPWLRKLVTDINLAYLSGYYRINKRQAVAMSLRYFSLGNITFTNDIGQVIQDYKPNEFAIDAAYAYKFTNTFSGAIALRYIYSNLTGGIFLTGGSQTNAGMSVASDISLYYDKPIKLNKMNTKFAFGFNISNIGAKISYTDNQERDFIPTNLKIGPSYSMDLDKDNSLTLMVDFNKLLVPTPPVYQLDSTGKYVYDANGNPIIEAGMDPNVGVVEGMIQSFYDAPGGAKEEFKEINFGIGLEYWYAKQFSIRVGYFNESETKGNRKYLTFGAGLRYSVFGLDFAYLVPVTVHNPLENTLRFSLLFNFDVAKNKKNEDQTIKKNE